MSRITPVIFRFLAISAIALSVPVSALAQQSQPAAQERMHQPAEAMAMHMLRGLDLTEAQSAQIKTLAEAQREQVKTAMQGVREQRQALHALALSDKYDAAAAAAKAEQLGRAEGEVSRLVAESMHKVYAILTPAQRTKLQERIAKGDSRDSRGARPHRGHSRG